MTSRLVLQAGLALSATVAVSGFAALSAQEPAAPICDPDVQLPTTLREVHAQFTADAMRAKVEGRIVLQGIVDSEGVIHDIRVLQPLEPSLDTQAQRALAEWRFRPATHMGESVAMAITVEMAITSR